MSVDYALIKSNFWSDICNTDATAYCNYAILCARAITAQQFGRIVCPDGLDECGNSETGDNSIANDVGGSNISRVKCHSHEENEMVGKCGSYCGYVDSNQHGGGCAYSRALDWSSCKFAIGGIDCCQRCVFDSRVNSGLQRVGWPIGSIKDAKVDGEPVGGSSVQLSDSVESVGENSIGGDVIADAVTLGKNTFRNREWRKKKKEKKNRRKGVRPCDISDNWRVGDSHKGFFSLCDDDTQHQLRETRAKLLIAENNRKLIEEEKKTEKINSPHAVIQGFLNSMKLANQLKRQSVNTPFSGWAKTVADSLPRDAAESVPSSIPSLESVGLGDSALRSSDGSDGLIDRRRIEYNIAMKGLKDHYENLEVYSEQKYQDDIDAINDLFEDVVLTDDQRSFKRHAIDLTAYLVTKGVSPMLLDEAIEVVGSIHNI